MTQPHSQPLDALQHAVQSELEGHHFYRMAAQATQDPKGREVFTRLAEEELEHARVLSGWTHRLSHSPSADTDLPTLSEPAPLAGPSPIFSESIRARVSEAHFEMTALSVGIQLEDAARRFYQEAAAQTEDPALAALFERLASWEAGHYRALLAQQEALKGEYWAASGFAPF